MPTLIRFLYKHFLKPILFLFDPSFIHENFIIIGRMLGSFNLTRSLTRTMFGTQIDKDTNFSFGGIEAYSKIGLSAGFDYDGHLTQILPELGFGYATIGTVTNLPYEGNPAPMIFRLPKSRSILVNKGLKNSGADKIIDRLEKLNFKIPIGISIGSTNKKYENLEAQIEDIYECFKKFENSKVRHTYYELNISCPNLNIENNGVFYNPKNLEKLLISLQKLQISRPIWVKLPITETAKNLKKITDLFLQYNITTFIMGNLQNKREILDIKEQEKIKNLRGNLSGAPTFTQALEFCKILRENYGEKINLIGVGGINSGEKAKEFLKYCDAIELITGMIYEGPTLVNEINKEIFKNKYI